jgi:D-amino-acid dehydrogenase
MEFLPLDAPPDPKKTERLRRETRNLGYGEAPGAAWVGGRPVLPDYLPGIGRALHAANLFYAVGHQHIGLTLAPVTGDLLADLVAGRTPRHPVNAFDLGRFGRGI